MPSQAGFSPFAKATILRSGSPPVTLPVFVNESLPDPSGPKAQTPFGCGGAHAAFPFDCIAVFGDEHSKNPFTSVKDALLAFAGSAWVANATPAGRTRATILVRVRMTVLLSSGAQFAALSLSFAMIVSCQADVGVPF